MSVAIGARPVAGPPSVGDAGVFILHGGGSARVRNAVARFRDVNPSSRLTLLVRRDEADVYKNEKTITSIEIIPSETELKSGTGLAWFASIRKRKALGIIAMLDDAAGGLSFRAPLMILAGGFGRTWLVDGGGDWYELSAAGLYAQVAITIGRISLGIADSIAALMAVGVWVVYIRLRAILLGRE